jgi:hypothetical protein
MLWLIFCGLFLLMSFNIFRMLRQRGKWAWILFLSLIASAAAYVGLVVLPLASSGFLANHRAWLVLILIAGTLIYLGGLFYFVRKIGAKLKPDGTLPPR